MKSEIEILEDRVTNLENMVRELRQQSNKEKEGEGEGFKLWKPKLNDDYYFNKPDGTLSSRRYEGNDYDEDVIAEYGAYPDNDVADEEANWLRAARKLRALARELNPEGWKYNNNKKEAFYIKKDNGDFCIYVLDWFIGDNCGQTLFHSFEAAQLALTNLTTEEREVLFGDS